VSDFLVERYLSRANASDVDSDARRARLAAAEMSGEGIDVRHVRSIFIPEDETCLDLYRAPSAAVVREAATRAGLVFERITEARESSGSQGAQKRRGRVTPSDRSG
jgi:Protein of unknown function (DUF4242)